MKRCLEDRSESSANEQSSLAFVPAAVIKCSNTSKLRVKRFILFPSSKVIMGGKPRQQVFEAAGPHCSHIQEPCVQCMCAAIQRLSPLMPSSTLSGEWSHPQHVCVPTSVHAISITPRQHAQRLPSPKQSLTSMFRGLSPPSVYVRSS